MGRPYSTSRYFLPILTSLPPVTLCHTSRNPPILCHTPRIFPPPPIFSRPSTKNRTKAPCSLQIISQLFVRAFVPGLLSGGLLSGRFCPGWFLSLPPSVRIHLLVLRLRSVSISILDIRDLRTSSLRIDSSTSGASLKLVLGGWSGLFAKSTFTSGPTIRVSTTTSWPILTISLLTISPVPRRNVISPATVFL